MENKNKATCSNCIHRNVCYKKLEFPDIVSLIEETGHCATYQIEFYDYVLKEIFGFEVCK